MMKKTILTEESYHKIVIDYEDGETREIGYAGHSLHDAKKWVMDIIGSEGRPVKHIQWGRKTFTSDARGHLGKYKRMRNRN
ncbi:MAG: hypothetical protein JKY48_01380 [Flavobacteriales bacterium]|nr:hypothetical protein [Flavobacteriales bacterium]